MARKRKFLTGSQRAEFEHIYGPLPVDQVDARFVLVTDEEEALIQSLPAGVPVRPLTQDPSSVSAVAAHFVNAAEKAGEDHAKEMAGVPADMSVIENAKPVESKDAATGSGSPAVPAEPVGKSAAPAGRASDGTSKK